MHSPHLFDWYLEIGCRSGDTFSPSRSKTIAVDPFFRVEQNAIGQKPALHVFQTTSDDFFASGFLEKNDIKLTLSFIDGMHLVEYALRDLINVERNSAPHGLIMVHDCIPFTHAMTSRDLDKLPPGPWTGDVWKLIPIIRRWRPDLTLTVLDAKPSGVVVLSGLNPKDDTLKQNYDAILAEFQTLTLEDYGLETFTAQYELTDCRAEEEAGFPLFKAIKLDEAQALKPGFVSK